MKAIIIFSIFLLYGCSPVIAQCPVKGDKNNAKFQHLDSLKNRSAPGSNIHIVNINDFFNCNAEQFTTDMYVQTTGYVKLVKYGGKETCNCHSSNKSDWDYHIEIIPTLNFKGLPMICEINRYVRPITYTQLKTMVGKKVTITGWIFKDIEHAQNSLCTNPKNAANDWRATEVEIHPVIQIKLIQ